MINRTNDRTNRVNAWLNNKTHQDACERIELETVALKIVQESKYRDCGVAKVPHSTIGNAPRKADAPLPSQTYDGAKQTLRINNQDVNLHTYLDRQGRNEYITLALQILLLMTVAILLSFFMKTKFDNLWRRVFLRNVSLRCCEHLALDNHVRWSTYFVHP